MTEEIGYPLNFAGETFIARGSGGLWWPARGWLIVSDLHLGRSERYARRGGALLPPYETQDTLARLAEEVARLAPKCVVSLGDSFDDRGAADALGPQAIGALDALCKGRDWLWIEGNHDPDPVPSHLPGRSLRAVPGPITLAHEAGEGPDISGHLHPCTRLGGQRWRCFVVGAAHLIMPAFGTYTGGLDIGEAAVQALAPEGIAVICAPRPFARPLGAPPKPKKSPRS